MYEKICDQASENQVGTQHLTMFFKLIVFIQLQYQNKAYTFTA